LSAASSPDGKTLAVGHVGAISLWQVDPDRLTPAGRLDTPPFPTCALAFAPDGGTLAAGNCGDGLVRVWRLGDGGVPERLDGSDDYQVRALAFSADGRALFVLDTDSNIVCLDLADHRRTVVRLGMPPVRGGAFGPDGRQVLAANFDGLARLAGGRGPVPLFLGTTGTRQ
jgi:WD40 repeat protein